MISQDDANTAPPSGSAQVGRHYSVASLEARRRAAERPALWLFLGLTAVALLGLPALLYPLHADQAMFAYIGDVWLHGGLPYRDAWDVKPPGMFALYALAQLVFGRNMVAAHAADLVATLVAAAGLFVLAHRQFPARIAVFAPLLFGIAYFTLFDYSETAQPESFAAPLSVWAVYGILRWEETRKSDWAVLAGLCVGCLVLLKTPFLLIGFLALYAIPPADRRSGRRSWRNSILFLLALAAPLLLTGLYFASKSALRELAELLAAQKAYGGNPPWGFGLVARWMPLKIGAFLIHRPFLLALTFLAFAPLRWLTWSRKQRYWPDQPVFWWWLAACFAAFAVQWRCFYYHYVLLLPPLALLAAGALARLCEAKRALPQLALRTAVTTLLVLVFAVPITFDLGRFRLAWMVETGQLSRPAYWALFAIPNYYPFANAAAVADYARAHTTPNDYILVYDFDPAIYYLADRLSPTRHLSRTPLYNEKSFPPDMRRRWIVEQIQDVRRRPPRLLIITGPPHEYGMSTSLQNQPLHIHFGADDYKYVTRFTRDKIYCLLPRPQRHARLNP